MTRSTGTSRRRPPTPWSARSPITCGSAPVQRARRSPTSSSSAWRRQGARRERAEDERTRSGPVKAVRGAEGGVSVVDLEEPPGTGELLDMRATSIRASDLMYIDFGTRMILGHELAGLRQDGTAVVVEALYGCG